MADIIKEYLLPVIDINNKLIKEIKDKTHVIRFYIDNDYCPDNHGNSYDTLINSKITKNDSNIWVIRYKN